MLLIRNHTTFLVQFEIIFALAIFSKSSNLTRPAGSLNLILFEKLTRAN